MTYTLFVNEIKKHRQVWLLTAYEGAYAMFEDISGQEYIPVWADEKSANSFIKEEWEGYHTEKMPIWEFRDWLEELKEDKIKLAFPLSEENTTIPILPGDLKQDILDL